MVKKLHFALLSLCLAVLCSTPAFANGHFGVGGEGFKIATMPESGLHWKIYSTGYSANKLKDDSGNTVSGSNTLDAFTQTHRLTWVTGLELFGGNHLIDIAMPFGWTRMSGNMAGTSSSRDGWSYGDLLLSPLLFAWHGDWYDFMLSPGIYIPIGDHDRDEPTAMGKGFWGLMPTIGLTTYFDEEKNFNFSWMMRYEWSGTQRNTDFRDGTNLHFEYALGRSFFDNAIDLSLVGAHTWQISDSHGKGDFNDKRVRKNMLGPEIGFHPLEDVHVYFHVLKEFSNRNTTQGVITHLSIIKSF